MMDYAMVIIVKYLIEIQEIASIVQLIIIYTQQLIIGQAVIVFLISVIHTFQVEIYVRQILQHIMVVISSYQQLKQ
jgi:hypothetical protein